MLFCGILASVASAVAPPKPGREARLPEVIDDWPTRRPGQIEQPLELLGHQKQGIVLHRVPVLLAGYADRAGSSRPEELQARFTNNGAQASFRDYWLGASGGRLEVVGEVQPWRHAPQTAAYYAGESNGMDLWSAPRNAGRFVRDVIAAYDAAGFDWGRYDSNGPDGVPNSGDDDDYVDLVIIVHAGKGGECGTDDLWSHAFFLSGWGYGAYETSIRRPDGGFVKVNNYILVPELSCSNGVIEIGVICHEYGHALGLPDLYDTVGDRAGVGGWCLMGTGGWGGDGRSPAQPTLPGAWSRHELGWARMETVRQDGAVLLPSIDLQDHILAVRDHGMPAGEVFLVENRLRRGLDASLPGSGLLIWHVDGSVIAVSRALNKVNAGPVLGLALKQADGQDHLGRHVGGNLGDAGDPWPGSTGKTVFASHTHPPSHDNAGRRTEVVLQDIPQPSNLAEFSTMIGVPWLDTTPPDVLVLSPNGGEDWTLGMMHTVAWQALDDVGVMEVDLHLSRDGGLTYPLRLARNLADSGSWSGSLGALPGESMVVRVTARDQAGNEGIALSGVFFLRDRFPPAVVMSTFLTDGDLLDPDDEVTISWQSADNVGVAAVDLQLSCDGGWTWTPTELTGLAAFGQATWTVPDRPCVSALLRAVARDAAGNEGTDQSPHFIIQGTTTSIPDHSAGLSLGPCVPNPFNPKAEIRVYLSAEGSVRMTVHDAAGRCVRTLIDRHMPSGSHKVVWDGRNQRGHDVASGVYWVRASGSIGQALLKITLVR